MSVYIAWKALVDDRRFSDLKRNIVNVVSRYATSFQKADLSGADFSDSMMEYADFRGTRLTKSRVDSARGWHLTRRDEEFSDLDTIFLRNESSKTDPPLPVENWKSDNIGNVSNLKQRVFLCHASGDKPKVRDLYHRLKTDGIEPWFDEINLVPGQNWDLEISKAVRGSDAVIVCLSCEASTKAGYVQKEIKKALDVADEQPDGNIFIIPVKLEPCAVPQRLSHLHWVDLFEQGGYDKLIRAIKNCNVSFD